MLGEISNQIIIHSVSAKNQTGVWEALDGLLEIFENDKNKPTEIVFKYEKTEFENCNAKSIRASEDKNSKKAF